MDEGLKKWQMAYDKMKRETSAEFDAGGEKVLEQLGSLSQEDRARADRLAKEAVEKSKGIIPFQLALSTAVKSIMKQNDTMEETEEQPSAREQFCREAWWHE